MRTRIDEREREMIFLSLCLTYDGDFIMQYRIPWMGEGIPCIIEYMFLLSHR